MGRCKFYIKVKKTQNNCNNHKKADSRKNWDMIIKSWYDHFFIRSPVANFLPNIRLFPCSWKHLSINLLTTKLPIWNKVNYSAISFCLENNVLSKITKQQSTNNFLVSIAFSHQYSSKTKLWCSFFLIVITIIIIIIIIIIIVIQIEKETVLELAFARSADLDSNHSTGAFGPL